VLERLQEAKKAAATNAAFTLVTTDRINPADPLASLQSKRDHSIELHRLFDGTKDNSKLGKVRALWRAHLGLQSDDELRETLSSFHIQDGHRPLAELRNEVNLKFRVNGLITCNDPLVFRFDQAIRELKRRKKNSFTVSEFEAICRDQGWLRPTTRRSYSVTASGDLLPPQM
jgi:hypothetical protein